MLGLDWRALGIEFINLVEVETHVFVLLALFVFHELAGVDKHFEMVVLVKDVLQELVRDRLGHVDGVVKHQSSAEVAARLHQVVCAEVVVFVRAGVVTAE